MAGPRLRLGLRLLVGAFAGALGGVAMKGVVQLVDQDSFGLSARTDAKTAHEIWRRMHWDPLTEEAAERIGAGIHYGFSVLAGMAYTAISPEFPKVRAGRGAAFGAALWLIGDEVAVSASGLEDPLRTPLYSHCSALAAHIFYGTVVDAVQVTCLTALGTLETPVK